MSASAPFLSIVSPVYRAEALVSELVRRLKASVAPLTANFEIILVDDGSPDAAWTRIAAEAAADARVRGLRLSRNFGQHYAITAGLDEVRGEWVVVLDCDLQDQPEEIPRLLGHAQAHDLDLVLAQRAGRQDGWRKRLGSRLFYGLLTYLTDTPQDPTVANFGVYHRSVIAAVGALRESSRYFPTMVRWVGFRAGKLPVAHAARPVGDSSYDLGRLLRLALDIILSYSDKPLRLTVKLGLLLALGAFGFALITLVRYATGSIIVAGYTSLITSIWLAAGLLLATLGMVGLYVGRTFEQVKNRPLYFVAARTAPSPSSPPA